MTDSERIDWLDRNLHSANHDRATCSVDMSGNCIAIRVENEALGRGAGPSQITVHGRSLRDAIDKAVNWKPEQGRRIL